MSVTASPKSATIAQPAKMPGEVVRGLVSLWLIVHFLGIVLAIVTQNELSVSQMDSENGRSHLLHRLKQVPPLDQYIYALWFDVPYGYVLANGGPYDADYSIELDLLDDKGNKLDTITWPSPETSFGELRERYAALAARAARSGESNNPLLAAAIGKSILTQRSDVKEVVFRVRRHQALSMQDVGSSDAAQRDPKHNRTYSTAYTAKVRLDSRGEAQVSVPQEARDVAAPNSTSSSSTEAPQGGGEAGNSSPRKADDGQPAKSPDATRPAQRQKRADPLPPVETAPKKFNPPPLFRPSDQTPDPDNLPK
jgi:hypothetical protein